jgi:hypothetical protein
MLQFNPSQLSRITAKSDLLSILIDSIEKPINDEFIVNQLPQYCKIEMRDDKGDPKSNLGDCKSLCAIDRLSQIPVFRVTVVEDLDNLDIPTRILIKPFLKKNQRYPYLAQINSSLFNCINLSNSEVQFQILEVNSGLTLINSLFNSRYLQNHNELKKFKQFHFIFLILILINTGIILIFGPVASLIVIGVIILLLLTLISM